MKVDLTEMGIDEEQREALAEALEAEWEREKKRIADLCHEWGQAVPRYES